MQKLRCLNNQVTIISKQTKKIKSVNKLPAILLLKFHVKKNLPKKNLPVTCLSPFCLLFPHLRFKNQKDSWKIQTSGFKRQPKGRQKQGKSLGI